MLVFGVWFLSLCLLCFNNSFVLGNKSISRGVANGSLVKIKHVSVMEEPKWCAKRLAHTIMASKVELIIVSHLEKPGSKRRPFRTLPVGCAAIRSKSTRVSLQSNKLRVTVFELLHAEAITGHKSQGMTINKVLVGEGRCRKKWMYVAISRVCKLRDLYLERSVTKQDFVLDKGTKDELERLEKVFTQTKKLFEHVLEK